MFIRYCLWLIFLSLVLSASAHAQWEKPAQPPVPPGDLRISIPHPAAPGKVLAADRFQIFEYEEGGSWKNVWRAPRVSGEIRRLLAFPERPDDLFILAESSLFQIHLPSGRSREVRPLLGSTQEILLAMALLPGDPDHWFVGTSRGLLESDNAGITWFRFDLPGRRPVSALLFARDSLFAAAGGKLFISRDLSTFRPLFSMPDPQEGEQSEEPEISEEQPAADFTFYDLAADARRPEMMRLATRDGVFETTDSGFSWQRLASHGLRSVRVEHLVQSAVSGDLFAGTPAGVYKYLKEENRWEELFEGLEETRINGLTLIKAPAGETLAAVTSAGFYFHPLLPDGLQAAVSPDPALYPLLMDYLNSEPPVREIHRAVVRSARLSNAKIHRWHAGSRLAALLPSFSFDKDFSRANNIDIDRGSTSDHDQFIAGPEDLDENWGFGVGWDLGDFIWSSAQTSIDSRDKLMVELRHDLLAEATRLYFERRRLILEFASVPPIDEADRLARMLRVDELTALLDGMTGGWYAKQLEKQPGFFGFQNSKFEILNKNE